MVTVQKRHPHYALPLILIVIGLVALLANLGLVATGLWERLFQLWPVLLLVIGIELLAGGESTRPAVRWGAFAVVLVLVAGATSYAVAPWLPAASPQGGTSSGPLGGLTSARLALAIGSGKVTVTSADLGQDLYRASYSSTGVAPSRTFAINGDTLQVKISRNFPGNVFGQGQDRLDLTLNQSIPWALTIDGAGVDGDVDLRTTGLRSLAVNSASGKLAIRLGSPTTQVPISFNGVAHDLTLSAPAGTAIRVHATGIASSVVLPGGQSLNGVVGDRSWESSGFSAATGSYSVEVNGVASKLTLEVPES